MALRTNMGWGSKFEVPFVFPLCKIKWFDFSSHTAKAEKTGSFIWTEWGFILIPTDTAHVTLTKCHKMANANWLLILILLCLFVWNKIHSCKLWNRCQPNSSDTSKKAQLIYDTAVLMSRQWIVALLWLIFIKPLHSLIMHRSAWPISWMLW